MHSVQSAWFLRTGGMLCTLAIASPAWAQVLPATSTGEPLVSYNELWFGRSYEEGVANRLLLDYHGVHQPLPNLEILTSASYSFLQQSGLALLGVGVQYNVEAINSRFAALLAHETWSSWGASENRVLAMWIFQPLDMLQLTVGVAYRAAQYQGLDWRHIVAFPQATAEINALYRLRWRFLSLHNVAVSALVFNYDRMRLYTPDNIHLALEVNVRLRDSWVLMGSVGAGISGVSGAILSWSQNNVGLGVGYAFF